MFRLGWCSLVNKTCDLEPLLSLWKQSLKTNKQNFLVPWCVDARAWLPSSSTAFSQASTVIRLFRVSFCLCIKTSLCAKPFIYENVFPLQVHFYVNQTHFIWYVLHVDSLWNTIQLLKVSRDLKQRRRRRQGRRLEKKSTYVLPSNFADG